MSEPPAVQPPVPKPRVNRPITSPIHQQDSENLKTQTSHESSRTPSPVPKPAATGTSEEAPPEGGASGNQEQVVQFRNKKQDHYHDNDEEYVEYDEENDDGDYENIDSLLDEDEQRQVRRSDYLNWVYVESDEDDGGGSPITGRNPPSVKLHNHPALKKSQSSNNMGESPLLLEALALKKQFEQHLQNIKSNKEGVRPKNRAPPPPPGSKQRGDKSPKAYRNSSSGAAVGGGGGGAVAPSLKEKLDRGHKRSQSDVHVIDYTEQECETERRREAGKGVSGSPVVTPTSAPGSGLGAGVRVQQGQRSPHSHPKQPHHRNKPTGPPPQFHRKHSPQTNNGQSHGTAQGGGLPPPPSYAPPSAPPTASSSSTTASSSSALGRPSGVDVAQKAPPSPGSHHQPLRRPNPPRTAGQRGQGAATGGQDKPGKDRTNKAYAHANIRQPPPPPSSGGGAGGVVSTGASSSSSSSASVTTEDDRSRGRGSRAQNQHGGGEERVYDRSPKFRRRQGAEKVYELLSKTRTDSKSGQSGQSPSMERQTSAPGEGAAIYAKPKRHAPPPPAATGGAAGGKKVVSSASVDVVQISEGPPEYSAVVSSRDGRHKDGEPTPADTRPPPKPVRQRRARSIEDLSQVGLETMTETQNGNERGAEVGENDTGGVLDNMEVITIELRRDGERSLGLMIVSGKARNSNEDVIDGVFVQKVIPGSLAEKDGRIQPGDMLVEVANQNMVGGALDKATELLQETRESIRLKIGRPDLTSSVFAVQDGEEHPIYETLERISPTERDLMVKLEKSQLKVVELEGEKDKVEKELKAYKEKARKDEEALKQKIKELQEMLDNKKAENENSVLELTQTLAAVTVEKTKVERALEERKNEVETLRQQLSDITSDKATVDEKLKETNLKLQETEDELGQIKTEKSALWTELVSGRERISDLEEKLKAAEANNATLLKTIREQSEEISSLKAELGRPSDIPRQPPPLPIESASKPPVPAPKTEKEPSTGDDDAFEDKVPSPVAPCPYLSFVPLQDDPRARHKKGKDSGEGKSKEVSSESTKIESEEQESPCKEAKPLATEEHLELATEGEDERTREATGVSSGESEHTSVAEQQDQDQKHGQEEEETATVEPADLPDFDVVKPLHKLDSRAALHKSQVGGQIKRKKPSRDHLRQMGSSSNLLDSIPDSNLAEEESTAAKSSESESPLDKEKEKEKEEEKEKDEQASKQQSVAVEQTATVAPPPQPPKPKPRAAPRKRNPEPPSSTEGDGNKPHAIPRHKSEGKELSPLPESESSGKEGVKEDEEGEATVTVTEESHSVTLGDEASPKVQRKEPLLPSSVMTSKAPQSSPKHLPPSPKRERMGSESEEHAPKPRPRGHGKAGKEEETADAKEAKIAELLKKDPSTLTVKEKALLAQRTVGALGHVDKTKLPPPIPRKPKHSPGGGEGETLAVNSEFERGRSQSIDEKEPHASPSHSKRKLPPGAVNIMAGLALSADRGRSNTVSTAEPDARERNSLGRNAKLQEDVPENGVKKSSSQEELEQTDHSTPTKPLPKTPPKRPPLPMQKKHSNEKPASVDGVDNESDSSPPLARRRDGMEDDGEHAVEDRSHDQSHDGGEEGVVDLNTVLTWTPEIVVLWLNNIGLGQYHEVFVGVQGYMLFDMDGHRLKGLGMSSHDDRNLFKKEIKNLKPYADKHKKLLDKQRKEEKKNAKKKKK